VDSATGAAWIAAAISAAGAVIAAVQAKHARDSARSAKSQAESAQRQAQAAENEVLLTRLKMRAGVDDALALHMFEVRVAVVRYLQSIIELLDHIDLMWSFSARVMNRLRPGTPRSIGGFIGLLVLVYAPTRFLNRHQRARLYGPVAMGEVDRHYDNFRSLNPDQSFITAADVVKDRLRQITNALGLPAAEQLSRSARHDIEDARALRETVEKLLANPVYFDR
jgi:hypothetical protein